MYLIIAITSELWLQAYYCIYRSIIKSTRNVQFRQLQILSCTTNGLFILFQAYCIFSILLFVGRESESNSITQDCAAYVYITIIIRPSCIDKGSVSSYPSPPTTPSTLYDGHVQPSQFCSTANKFTRPKVRRYSSFYYYVPTLSRIQFFYIIHCPQAPREFLAQDDRDVHHSSL